MSRYAKIDKALSRCLRQTEIAHEQIGAEIVRDPLPFADRLDELGGKLTEIGQELTRAAFMVRKVNGKQERL